MENLERNGEKMEFMKRGVGIGFKGFWVLLRILAGDKF